MGLNFVVALQLFFRLKEQLLFKAIKAIALLKLKLLLHCEDQFTHFKSLLATAVKLSSSE